MRPGPPARIRPNARRPIENAPPTIAPLGVDPRTGRVTATPTTDLAGSNPSICERDRLALASLDNAQRVTKGYGLHWRREKGQDGAKSRWEASPAA